MQIILNGIIAGGIYALMALGFNLIYSSVRFFHMLYGVLAVLGVYLTRTLMVSVHWGFFPSMFIGAIITGLISLFFWQCFYRPMIKRRASSLVMMVISFGLLIVLQNFIALIWTNTTHAISVTDNIVPGYQLWGLVITFNQLVILGSTVALVILMELFLKGTKYGLAIRAIGDNAELTTILGLKTNQIVLLVFFIGTFISSVGASLVSLEIGVRPVNGLFLVLKAIIASIIGGIGSMRGALLGGLLLGITENLGIYFLGGNWQDVTAFSLLTLFLLFKPRGLFSKASLSQ